MKFVEICCYSTVVALASVAAAVFAIVTVDVSSFVVISIVVFPFVSPFFVADGSVDDW